MMRLAALLVLAAVVGPSVTAEASEPREEPLRFAVGGDTLAGTLTLPDGEGPHPAVVFLSGGGQDDRDARVGEFLPFRILALAFAANGVASLRYDDRGVGESLGRGTWDYALDGHAAEALAAVALLRSRPDIAADGVGLLGHSYGTWMAARAAELGARPRFLVLLAPSTIRYRDLQAGLQRRLAILEGRSPAEAAEAARFELEVFGRAVQGRRAWSEVESLVRERARREWQRRSEATSGKDAEFEAYFSETFYARMLKMGPTPMMRFFWDFDARPTYRRVREPVLAVFGGADPLCAPEESAPAVRRALQEGGNRDPKLVIIPDADHYLRRQSTSTTDFAPGVVGPVVDWVTKQCGSAAKNRR